MPREVERRGAIIGEMEKIEKVEKIEQVLTTGNLCL